MKRRDFLTTSTAICAGGGAMLTILSSCGGVAYYARAVADGNTLSVPLAEFLDSTTTPPAYRAFVMVTDVRLKNPLCVYRKDAGTFVALSTACTHKGCQLRPSEQDLVCPCHGSEFSTDGKVLSPPADRNLPSYPTRVTLDAVIITV